MQISVTDAKAQLTELVRRALAGEDIVLTRDGIEAVRLAPIRAAMTPEARRAVMERIMAETEGKATPGPDAARSQDFLYDENGLPA